MDLRTTTKQLGTEEKAKELRCNFLHSRSGRFFQKNHVRIGARNLLRMGLVLARVWGGQAQMAASADKEASVSSSLFMLVDGLEVEEELTTMATFGAKVCGVDGQMEKGAAAGVEAADL